MSERSAERPDSAQRADSARALDPEVAKRVANLTLAARKAVEGLLTGIHKSPHRGASVVFVEHREYRPGDDLRLLDWRAFARSDRHQIKRFEQETHLRATLVLDRSGSMAYGGKDRASKIEHAATLLAALAFVLVRQGDAAGLVGIDERVHERLAARTRPAHLEELLRSLAVPAHEGAKTDLAAALTQVAERAGRRGLVAIASDLIDFGERALAPLAHLVSHGHDVVVFHVLDPDELELPFQAPARFEGLEGESPIEADPDALRAAYLERMQSFLHTCRSRCLAAGARYRLARTDEPVERTLAAVLTSGRRRGFA
ncbi:MAG: DUF58 domain-containing protein [Sandaracinaceae bacterium]|nr:DUF58 domain-containing protein [Sandaracinaceae bacterium]